MTDPLKSLELIEVNIPYKPPKKLEALAKKVKGSTSKLDIKHTIVFPPMGIDVVLKHFLQEDFKKLNFFDIMRLLTEIEKDTLQDKIKDKVAFVQILQTFFHQNPRYIQNFILKKVAIILKNKKSHSLKIQLSKYMTSKEFRFVNYCINKDFKAIKKEYGDKSLKQILKGFTLKTTFPNLSKEYANYLIKELKTMHKINENNNTIYKNNLLDDEDITHFYQEIEKLISLIEKKIDTNNSIDKLLSDRLGDIDKPNSNWHNKQVPLDLQDRYRRIKGTSEFQRFMIIAEYLAPSLEQSNANETSSDAKRLTNRSLFWSNYDERFSSVQIWVSLNDYEEIRYRRIVSLDKINILEDIDSEVCLLEFKEINLSVLVFFRSRANGETFHSLIFENFKSHEVHNILSENSFSVAIYRELKSLADYRLRETYLWIGWVDKFLRDKKMYPNKSILDRKEQFKITPTFSDFYGSLGLEETRETALEKKFRYENVIEELN